MTQDTGYEQEDPGTILGSSNNFYPRHQVQNCSGTHPAY